MSNDKDIPGAVKEISEKNNVHCFPPPEELMKKIKGTTFDDLISAKLKPIEHVLWPWFPTHGLSLIFAASGVGKTMFALNVAYAIAKGGNFLTYKAPKPRKVLYIDGEMSFNEIHSRFMDIVKQQDELFFRENWLLLNHEKIYPAKFPKIETPEGQAFYNKFFEDNNIEVVIFDNLSTLSSFEENKSDHWLPIQDWFCTLRAKGMSVIAIHHTGKDPLQYRGTSRMLDVLDCAICISDINQELSDGELGNFKKLKITYKKSRGFGGKLAAPFEAKLSPMGWEFQSMEITNVDKVVDCLNAKMSQREIAKELGMNQTAIYRLIKKAKLTGKIMLSESPSRYK